jgi:hypothetical protein
MGLRNKALSPRDRGKDKNRAAGSFDHSAYNRYLSDRGDRPSKDDESFTINPSREPTAREKNLKNSRIPDQSEMTKPVEKARWEKQGDAKSKAQGQGSYTSSRPYTRPDEDNY